MGLDMYAYVAAKEGQQRAFYESAEFDDDTKEFVNKTVEQPREIAYWRKHPNLHGWMEQLWRNKKYSVQPTDASTPTAPESDMFNGIELELVWEDLEILELDIIAGSLPGTSGFFFGDPADDHYREQDLKFIRDARAELFCGLKVFYNSSW
jgi:hypothetical protein